MWRAAAVCSVDPAPFTVGELLYMLEQREKSEWDRQSHLMWLIASIFSGKGKKPKPSDFNPYARSERPTVSAVQLGELLGFKKGPDR